jgi:hypothetical protein
MLEVLRALAMLERGGQPGDFAQALRLVASIRTSDAVATPFCAALNLCL